MWAAITAARVILLKLSARVWALDANNLTLHCPGVVVGMPLGQLMYRHVFVRTELGDRQRIEPPWLGQLSPVHVAAQQLGTSFALPTLAHYGSEVGLHVCLHGLAQCGQLALRTAGWWGLFDLEYLLQLLQRRGLTYL